MSKLITTLGQYEIVKEDMRTEVEGEYTVVDNGIVVAHFTIKEGKVDSFEFYARTKLDLQAQNAIIDDVVEFFSSI